MGNSDEIFPVSHAWHGATDNTVAEAVRGSLQSIDLDAKGYCGKSLRVGWLTTALGSGVPSDLYELLSGHSSEA
eukprot:3921459-Rhodomonas_salina.2